MHEKKKKAFKLIGKTIVYTFAGFGIIFILVLLGVLSLMNPKSTLGRIPDNSILNIDFNLAYAEMRQDDLFAEFTKQSAYSVFDLIRAINVAGTDDRIKAISATLNTTGLSTAQIEDVASALRYFQSKGKKAYLYSTGLGSFGQGTKEYYLASFFDEIWMQPVSDVGITGVAVEVPFFKNTLEKIGVEPEFYARYEYKTAVESLLNSDFTPTYKEEIEKLAGGLNKQYTTIISSNRKLSESDVLRAVDMAPVCARDALNMKLIDHIGYRFEMNESLYQKYHAKNYAMTDYMAHMGENTEKKLPMVAFLVLEGVIEDGESSNNPVSDAVIGSESVLKQIEELKDIENLKALVLRINSPGGSYAASDEIRAALVNLKKQKNIKIVVSMSTYAASGGYFISLAGDYIMADSSTITGSIGVFGGKFVLSGLTDKLGIHFGEVKYGQNAGILSMNHKFSETEKQVFEKSLDEVYQDFTTKVSEVRHIDISEMDRLARGRIWLGIDAVQNHLVDELGGLQHAIAKAKELAGIHAEDKFVLQYYPRRETFQEKLTKFIENGGNLPMMKVLSDMEEFKVLYRLKHDAILPPMMIKM
ncbi:MAG: signal peptide peptidase SppA [Alphaproteobacteria bacterium]|nr:signal peptide peptidase SppA [Alphaproteobacteria bacterium]